MSRKKTSSEHRADGTFQPCRAKSYAPDPPSGGTPLPLPTQDAPKHLSASVRDYWRSVVAKYQLDVIQLRHLELACGCLDRFERAKKTLEKKGEVYVNRQGNPAPRPEVKIRNQSLRDFLAMVKQLGIE